MQAWERVHTTKVLTADVNVKQKLINVCQYIHNCSPEHRYS